MKIFRWKKFRKKLEISNNFLFQFRTSMTERHWEQGNVCLEVCLSGFQNIQMSYKGSLWKLHFQTTYKLGYRYFRLRGVHFCSQNLLNISASRVMSSQTFHMVFPCNSNLAVYTAPRGSIYVPQRFTCARTLQK